MRRFFVVWELGFEQFALSFVIDLEGDIISEVFLQIVPSKIPKPQPDLSRRSILLYKSFLNKDLRVRSWLGDVSMVLDATTDDLVAETR
jgi:hypothetical protein